MINDTPLLHGVPKLVVYARTSFQQGDLAKAAQLYEQACHVNPDDYQAPSLLAPVYKSLGRDAEADATRRRALQLAEKHAELHPDDARALYLGAGILCQLGQRGRGLEWAQRAPATDPEETSIIATWAVSTLSRANRKKQSTASKRRRHAGTGIRAGRKKTPTWILYAAILASRRYSSSAQGSSSDQLAFGQARAERKSASSSSR
jgi:tetratricopeptide (TPR) repeat protein